MAWQTRSCRRGAPPGSPCSADTAPPSRRTPCRSGRRCPASACDRLTRMAAAALEACDCGDRRGQTPGRNQPGNAVRAAQSAPPARKIAKCASFAIPSPPDYTMDAAVRATTSPPSPRARVEARQKPVQRVPMRPSLLDPLFAALTTLPGVGPKLEKLYRRLLGRDDTPARVIDLLFHLPTGTVDRRARPKLRDVVPGSVVTVAVTVDRHRPPPPNRPRAPYQIYASDDTGDLTLTYLPRQARLSRKALAGRRAPLRLRHHRALRRHAADGASRPRGERGRARQAADGRAGLSAHRRA